MVWHHVTVSVLLRVTMLSLDDKDLIADRMIASVEPEPRRRLNLRPLLLGLLVLLLGDGLGGGAYLLSNMDTRDVIALLDADRLLAERDVQTGISHSYSPFSLQRQRRWRRR